MEMEEDFEIATLSAGLMERVKDTLTRRSVTTSNECPLIVY